MFLAFHGTGAVGRMEGAANVFAHLGPGFEAVSCNDAGRSQYRHSEGPDSIPIAHRDTFLAEKTKDTGDHQ
jgi:hypothetical protein